MEIAPKHVKVPHYWVEMRFCNIIAGGAENNPVSPIECFT